MFNHPGLYLKLLPLPSCARLSCVKIPDAPTISCSGKTVLGYTAWFLWSDCVSWFGPVTDCILYFMCFFWWLCLTTHEDLKSSVSKDHHRHKSWMLKKLLHLYPSTLQEITDEQDCQTSGDCKTNPGSRTWTTTVTILVSTSEVFHLVWEQAGLGCCWVI